MPTIISHPSNIALLRSKLADGDFDRPGRFLGNQFTIRENPQPEQECCCPICGHQFDPVEGFNICPHAWCL